MLVIGAGGLAKEVADLVTAVGLEVEAFYAEPSAAVLHPVDGVPVLDDLDAARSRAAVIAIGDTGARKRFAEMLRGRFELPSLVHPSACVSASADLADGVLVMQNAVVNAGAMVGAGTLLNVACCVAHDCTVGAYCHLAPVTQMGGGASLGDGVFCGTSSVVLPNTSVGAWSVCGAGAVVTADVPPRSLAVGVPARVVKTLS